MQQHLLARQERGEQDPGWLGDVMGVANKYPVRQRPRPSWSSARNAVELERGRCPMADQGLAGWWVIIVLPSASSVRGLAGPVQCILLRRASSRAPAAAHDSGRLVGKDPCASSQARLSGVGRGGPDSTTDSTAGPSRACPPGCRGPRQSIPGPPAA